jgi:phosphoesterase RecJ-like protein
MTTLNSIAARLAQAERIVLITHVDPDPDAIGSTLGLGQALLALNKSVAILNDDGVPSDLAFLPGADLFQKTLPDGFSPQVLVCLDSSDTSRLGEVAVPLLSAGLPIYNLDHHVTNVEYGTLNLIDPDAASTAEMIPPLLDALTVPIDEAIAACLLAGVVGDTRSFSTDSVTPNSLAVGSRLVAAGADIRMITEAIFNRRDYNTLRLWGLALSNVRLEKGVIWTAISADERRQKGLNWVGATGMSNLLLTAQEAKVSAVMTEQDDGKVRLSMRARPGFDVSQTALELGGGGHPLAAGATLEGPLDKAARRVVTKLKKVARKARKA